MALVDQVSMHITRERNRPAESERPEPQEIREEGPDTRLLFHCAGLHRRSPFARLGFGFRGLYREIVEVRDAIRLRPKADLSRSHLRQGVLQALYAIEIARDVFAFDDEFELLPLPGG